MDQSSTNSIFLIRFTLQSHVISGHQAERIVMTLQEAIRDGLFNDNFRKCNELLPMSGAVIKRFDFTKFLAPKVLVN